MAVYVEKINTFKRSLEKQVEELHSELQCRLSQIEQTQYELLKSFGLEFDIVDKYLYTLSPKKSRRLIAEMNFHHFVNQGHAGEKLTKFKHAFGEKDAFGDHKHDSHVTEQVYHDIVHDRDDNRCDSSLLRSKTSAKGSIKKSGTEYEYVENSKTSKKYLLKRGTSFSETHGYDNNRVDNRIEVGLKRNSSFTTTRGLQMKHHDQDGANADANLTAFSRYTLNHTGTPLKRRTFDSTNNDKLKRGIRTKVVQNYLLCDVFKRLSDRNNSLARMKIDGRPEESTEEGHYTYDVVKDLQHCRYLRVPKSLQDPSDDKLTKVDID